MAKSNQNNLDMVFNLALKATMAGGIAIGLLWGYIGIFGGESSTTDNIANILLVVVSVGGFTMGVLYLAKKLMKK